LTDQHLLRGDHALDDHEPAQDIAGRAAQEAAQRVGAHGDAIGQQPVAQVAYEEDDAVLEAKRREGVVLPPSPSVRVSP